MDKIALFVWSIVISFSIIVAKHTGNPFAYGLSAFAVCVFVIVIYVGITK